MTQLDRAWLSKFLTDYQAITFQIEQHKKSIEELSEEIVSITEECNLLSMRKEIILKRFLDVAGRIIEK